MGVAEEWRKRLAVTYYTMFLCQNLPSFTTVIFYMFQSTFFVEWNPPTIGIIGKDRKKSSSKGDFAIQLDSLVEAGSKTGYRAWVKRAIDSEKR